MQPFKYPFVFIFSLLMVSLTGCTSVKTQPLNSDKTFLLTTTVQDAPTDYDYYRLRKKAEALCPIGYDVESQAFGAKGALPKSQLQCVSGCDVTLQWKIHCTDRKSAPFSIFGNY